MNQKINRRSALKTISSAFGSLAFAAMVTEQALAENKDSPLSPKTTHFAPKAKRVIFLSMSGAPSHVDTFDYKPKLTKDTGRAAKYGGGRLLGSPWKFKQRGESGLYISSLFPNLGEMADDLCLLRGMHCDQPNHPEATKAAHTGTAQFVRPSLGAWSLYGLGTENTDLPGFMVLGSRGSKQNYGSGFLPAYYQGMTIGSGSRGFARRGGGGQLSIPNVKNPNLSDKAQRVQLEFIQRLNRDKLRREKHQPQIEGMIQSLELGFKMQTTMPNLLDLSKESEKTKAMYGLDNDQTSDFGRQCLIARRMVESGVRFIELTSNGWDHHTNLKEEMEDHCAQIDKPIAALLTDLKRLDLLKDTLVIWAGEFGRTPHGQGGDGRDHNNKGYTTFMAGGGVKGGFSYGGTDEYGYEAVKGRMHTHDWHATILHLLGLDHEKLTYRHAGRDFRLTDVYGKVAEDIIA